MRLSSSPTGSSLTKRLIGRVPWYVTILLRPKAKQSSKTVEFEPSADCTVMWFPDRDESIRRRCHYRGIPSPGKAKWRPPKTGITHSASVVFRLYITCWIKLEMRTRMSMRMIRCRLGTSHYELATRTYHTTTAP